jgi:hypothetical protein
VYPERWSVVVSLSELKTDAVRFKDFWQLRMMLKFAAAACGEPPEGTVEDGEAFAPGETRWVPNPIDIRVLFI